jgi:protein-tyrosine-phosphatase/DNA-binding HxlR family transcriptional regulator
MSPAWSRDRRLCDRAAVHAALGEPARLAIVEALVTSDRSPKELGDRLGLPSNLLAHHLEVLEDAGVVTRSASAGDGRRKYVRLDRRRLGSLGVAGRAPRGDMLFLCSQNSARSQLAAALWTARTGRHATSAGTRPAASVHKGAVAAAKRAGVSLADAVPTELGRVSGDVQVVTVCDLVHEELDPRPDWWHWSIPDPVVVGDARAFDAVVAELEMRIASVANDVDDDDGASR